MAHVVASQVLIDAFPGADLKLKDEQASGFISHLAGILATHPFVGQKLLNAEGIAADLDYTLVESKPGFEALNNEIGRRTGVTDLSVISEMDALMRGQPLDVYLSAFHKVCTQNGRHGLALSDFLQIREGVIEDLDAGRLSIPGGLSQVPDSFILLAIFKDAWKKTTHVCTHCPRLLANAFVREAGFRSLVDSSSMTCGDDSSLAKNSEEYWRKIVSVDSAARWVGLDDTSDGAEWMLRLGKFGLVIVRPSSPHYLGKLSILQQEFGEKLFVLQEFGDLFAFRK